MHGPGGADLGRGCGLVPEAADASCRLREMARLLLIGVDFDSCARDGAVADAATELRRLGLVDRLVLRHDVVDWGELITSAPVAERSAASGLLNEEALLLLVRRLRDAVGHGLSEDATPFVYGADCAVLLGALAGRPRRAGRGRPGLRRRPRGRRQSRDVARWTGGPQRAGARPGARRRACTRPAARAPASRAGRATGAARPTRPAGARRPRPAVVARTGWTRGSRSAVTTRAACGRRRRVRS